MRREPRGGFEEYKKKLKISNEINFPPFFHYTTTNNSHPRVSLVKKKKTSQKRKTNIRYHSDDKRNRTLLWIFVSPICI